MMPIWVLLKMVYVLFLSQHNVPKGAAQMTLRGLFVEFWNFHTISSGCMLHVPNKIALNDKTLEGMIGNLYLIPIPTFTLYL